MLKVILVDDDKAILAGLAKLIDWNRYGCRVIGTFLDPFSTLAFCGENAPDIVITDIRMPGMLGLELITKLRALLPDAVFIMLTAYDEFDYAKRALSNGAFRYLLKPIDENELIEALASAGEALQSRRQASSERRKLRDFMHTYKCVECLYGLLSLGGPPEIMPAQTPETEALYQYGALSPYRIAAVRRQPGAPGQAALESAPPAFCISTVAHDIYILVGEKTPHDKWRETLVAAASEAGQVCAVSGLLPSLQNLYVDCGTLTTFLEAKAFLSTDAVFELPASVNPAAQKRELADVRERLARLPEHYTTGDAQALTDELEGIAALLNASEYPPSPGAIREACQNMFAALANYYRQYYSAYADSVELVERAVSRLRACARFEQVRSLCLDLFNELFPKTSPVSGNSSLQIVNMARVYIAKNLDREISINDIARAVFVSPSYLSSIFKKQTGEKLWSYVIRIRLEKAYDYLTNTDMRINQVAQDCGFQNTNTFYYSFKKQYGFAPGKFRQQNDGD